jgi:hypothetical protein
MGEGRRWRRGQSLSAANSGGVGVAGMLARATTDKAGRARPMSNKAPCTEQAGLAGKAAQIGQAVGGVHSNDQPNLFDLWTLSLNSEVEKGRFVRTRQAIRVYDKQSYS